MASALMARSSTLRANLLTSSLRDCRCTPGRVATVDRLPPSCAGNSRPQTVNSLHPSGPKKPGTGTLVRVRQEGFAANVANATGHGKGRKRVLGWLEAVAER